MIHRSCSNKWTNNFESLCRFLFNGTSREIAIFKDLVHYAVKLAVFMHSDALCVINSCEYEQVGLVWERNKEPVMHVACATGVHANIYVHLKIIPHFQDKITFRQGFQRKFAFSHFWQQLDWPSNYKDVHLLSMSFISSPWATYQITELHSISLRYSSSQLSYLSTHWAPSHPYLTELTLISMIFIWSQWATCHLMGLSVHLCSLSFTSSHFSELSLISMSYISTVWASSHLSELQLISLSYIYPHLAEFRLT